MICLIASKTRNSSLCDFSRGDYGCWLWISRAGGKGLKGLGILNDEAHLGQLMVWIRIALRMSSQRDDDGGKTTSEEGA